MGIMTDEFEQTLRELPPEAPPPEIVLAAVRTFRYRAIASVAAIIAGAFLLGAVWRSVGPDDFGAAAAGIDGGIAVPILETGQADGIEIAVTELVWDETRSAGFVRYIAHGTGSYAEVDIEPRAVVTSTGVRPEIDIDGNPVLQDYTTRHGERIDRPTAGGWIGFTAVDHDPFGPLTVEFEVRPVPLEIVLDGGTLEGPFPTITITFEGLDSK
jgi:hypothetical protein